MTDAMGHKVRAALPATTVVVRALRNARRSGCVLDEQATRASRALAVSVEGTGDELQDDATALCIDWHGPGGGERDAPAGAER